MPINEMTMEQVNERLAEIRSALDGECDVTALTAEVDELEARRTALREAAEQRAALVDRIANSDDADVTTIQTFEREESTMAEETRTYDASSVEYRNAWLKTVANGALGELTEAEERAYTMTTANSGAVVPTEMQDHIVERVLSESPMLEDADVTNIAGIFTIPVHTAVAAGDAAAVAEGSTGTDEENTFIDVTMAGVEILKTVTITRKMKFQSIASLQSYLEKELADRIRVAKEKVILARLNGSAAYTGETPNSAVAIAAGNVLSGATVVYDDATIRNIMSKIKGVGNIIVYANQSTIWNGLAGIQDLKGNPRFIPSSMDDPIVAGRIYGATVKRDPNLTDNVAYFGIKGAVKANSNAPLEVFATLEPKTANTIYTASEIFDAGLTEPESFVKATFTPGE